ncbi:MAG: hypothetical protein WD492_00300 [Alkalispirochaeta sp.]
MESDIDLLRVLGTGGDQTFRMKVVSSLLRYFIDPHADHGLGTTLLKELLHDTSSNWQAIDQALLDSLGCYPGIPDLEIEVTGTEGDSFLVLLRYETALFIVGFRTRLPGLPAVDLVEDMVEWRDLLADSSCWFSSAEMSEITRTHRAVVCVGPTMKAGPDVADSAAYIASQANIDFLHFIPWRKSGDRDTRDCRSVEELLETLMEHVASDYLADATHQTGELLRRVREAVAASFRFDVQKVKCAGSGS